MIPGLSKFPEILNHVLASPVFGSQQQARCYLVSFVFPLSIPLYVGLYPSFNYNAQQSEGPSALGAAARALVERHAAVRHGGGTSSALGLAVRVSRYVVVSAPVSGVRMAVRSS